VAAWGVELAARHSIAHSPLLAIAPRLALEAAGRTGTPGGVGESTVEAAPGEGSASAHSAMMAAAWPAPFRRVRTA
jgi:hypothetical protein